MILKVFCNLKDSVKHLIPATLCCLPHNPFTQNLFTRLERAFFWMSQEQLLQRNWLLASPLFEQQLLVGSWQVEPQNLLQQQLGSCFSFPRQLAAELWNCSQPAVRCLIHLQKSLCVCHDYHSDTSHCFVHALWSNRISQDVAIYPKLK